MNKLEFGKLNTIAVSVRLYLIAKYGGNLDGKCKEAADLVISECNKIGIKCSKHFGWCLYDTCEGITGEPCAPHCYVLIHDGQKRVYLDTTATQFQHSLEEVVPDIIILASGERPYWFRSSKPSIREMENHSGY